MRKDLSLPFFSYGREFRSRSPYRAGRRTRTLGGLAPRTAPVGFRYFSPAGPRKPWGQSRHAGRAREGLEEGVVALGSSPPVAYYVQVPTSHASSSMSFAACLFYLHPCRISTWCGCVIMACMRDTPGAALQRYYLRDVIFERLYTGSQCIFLWYVLARDKD